MKVALLTEPRCIKLEDIEIPRPRPTEVLIRLKSCGVCATDVKKFTGSSKAPQYPFILGHEPSGVVVECGQEVTSTLKPEMRVAIAPVILCGKCYSCRSGITLSQGMGMCQDYEVMGFSVTGAFSEFVVAPMENVYPIPDRLSFTDAALIEPVAACANGVLRVNSHLPGTIVVIGAGFMGLVCVQLLKLLGNRVISTDLVEDRRQLALNLGADFALDPSKEDPVDQIRALTGEKGADGIICAVGSSAITEQGLAMLGKGGTLVLLASAPHGTKFEVDLNKLHYDQSVITGSVSYTGASYQWAMDLLSDHKLDTASLITHTGPIEKTADFLEMTEKAIGLKKVILL
jgi:2-desacetyl-2-hydroxyethyl bacteriochlorophyllide A dehydrogenase